MDNINNNFIYNNELEIEDDGFLNFPIHYEDVIIYFFFYIL